jgi:hypothetical protein
MEAGKNEPIEIAKNKPLWRLSLQAIELVAQRHDVRLERSSRSEEPDDHPPDQLEHVSHGAEHRPTCDFAPAIEFTIGTRVKMPFGPDVVR